MRDLVAWYADWNRPDGPPPERKPDKQPKRDEPPPPRPDRTPPKKAHAIVVGRFDPLHRGHVMLIDAARTLAARTTIVVRTQPTDAVPAATRLAWCQELAPTAELACPPPPGDPTTVAFWQHWAHAIRAVTPDADALVTSDRDAWRLADVLGVAFTLIDPDRLAVPISARDLRADPHAHWDHLAPAVRAHYATRVTILGPEGSGKSTLARALADHLSTTHVPEHARTLAERRGTLSLADLAHAVDTQHALEHALARQCNRILVSDTDARSLALWAERLHGHCPPALAAHAAASRPDLYVLAEPLPLPNTDTAARTAFARCCREVVASSGVRWIVVGGSIEQRVASVVSALRGRIA